MNSIEDMNNVEDKVSTLIKLPRDKDGNIQYHLMPLNTGIYIIGDDPFTTKRRKNSSHCNKLCPCHVEECNFGRFAKWLGDDKRWSFSNEH